MPRLAIIEPVVCAAGVERFVHNLVGAAIDEGFTDQWEIVLVRNRVNTANLHIPWPDEFRNPSVHIVYPPLPNGLARTLDNLSGSRRMFGIPGTGMFQRKVAKAVRSAGPASWRIYCGDIVSWVEDYLRSHSFDVVYCPYPDLIAPPRIRQPIVATIHDFVFKYSSDNSPGQQQRDKYIREWLEVSHRIINSSESVGNDLKRFYPAYAHKAQIIRLGYPAAGHVPSAEKMAEVLQRLALPAKFVLIVGSMMQHKNQHIVFEAVVRLRERGIRMPLVCVGPNTRELHESRATANSAALAPRYTTKIINLCYEAGLENGVDYFTLGFVDDFDLECLYRSARMLIVPSITEAFSLPAMEAMRAMCPVVFSRVPPFLEILEVIQNNAWSFPADDANVLADVIQEVSSNLQEARHRAAAAMEIAPRVYSWTRVAREYFSIFSHAANLSDALVG